jgi:succinate dehydrogenase/fumarate reductase cytochrome b subunit
MRYAPESIEIVNYQLKRNGEKEIDEVEVGASYGNPYTYSYAVINNENCLHALQPYDSLTLSNMVGFFGYVFDNYDANGLTQRGIKDSNQAWLFKEIGGGMVLAGGFVFIMALFILLLKTRAFASLKKEIPARTGDQKIKGRIFFWVAFVASAVIAYFLYMVAVQKSVEWFPDAAGSVQTWFFPQRFTNAIMLWAVANGLIGVCIFFITWGIEYAIDYVRAKKTGAVLEVKSSYISKLDPLKLKGSDFWKTPLLAAILILSFFALDGLCYAIFHVDMRFFVISARFTLNPKAILAMAMYLPLFFIFSTAVCTLI